MTDRVPEHEWTERAEFDYWEVSRWGDHVYLLFDNQDGVAMVYALSPSDAAQVGAALVISGRDPE